MKKTLLSLFLSLFALVLQAQEKYLVHSSGNVLGMGSESRAVLCAPDKAQPLAIAEAGSGTSHIILADGGSQLYLALGTSNSWSTFFLADGNQTRARYTIEQSGMFVLLKNAFTGKYLGTDGNEVGAYVYSDKSGTDTKHQWRLSDTPTVELTPDTLSYYVAPNTPLQTIEGWGVSLCWWANMCGKWSDAQIDKLVDWMVSPTGLNWNLFRYNIGGGDDPKNAHCTPHHMGNGKGLRAEMEGFQDERGGEFHWERDEAQRRIMLRIREKRPDAIFEAFSNSAPWWMTNSGCCAGAVNANNDNLNPKYYEDFARYLVEVCKHYKEEYGIEFRTLEPFNEPNTNYWGANGSQEGCHFDYASQIAFLRVLAPILQESGLSTVIAASDETDVARGVAGFREYQKAGIIDLVGQWNSHTYSANNSARSQMGSLARSLGMRQWMSEVGSGGSGLQGNLNMAQKLFDDVRYMQPDAWLDWQFVEENNDQWCLVQAKFDNPSSARRVPNYYVRQQVTRFIPAGYHWVPALNSHALAAVNPEQNQMVLCLLNAGNNTAVHNIHLANARVELMEQAECYRTSQTEKLNSVKCIEQVGINEFFATLPPLSITTIILPFVNAEIDGLGLPGTFVLVPQSNHEVAVSSMGGAVKMAAVNPADGRQHWSLHFGQGDQCRLENADGSITYDGSYALKMKHGEADTQYFDLLSVSPADHYHKLMSGTKSFDLSGATSVPGTTVGMYNYGTEVTADTRQFLLVHIDTDHSAVDAIDAPSLRPTSSSETIYDLQGRHIQKTTRPGLYIQNGRKVLLH